MNKHLNIFRALVGGLELLSLWGAYVSLHGLPAAILTNDNPTQNTDRFFWSVVWAIVWGTAFMYLMKPQSNRPKANTLE